MPDASNTVDTLRPVNVADAVTAVEQAVQAEVQAEIKSEAVAAPAAPAVDTGDFITRDEFNQLAARVELINSRSPYRIP
jgi:hypothetical protein